MAERALALGEDDHFDYVLARDLGRTLAELGQMSQAEYVRWRAFYNYQTAAADLAVRSGAARG